MNAQVNTTTAYECFDVEIEGCVAHIRLKRPEAYNSMIRPFWNELPAIVTDISDNARARCIVISSTGKHFSSGHDLRPGGKNAAGVDFPPVGNWGGFAEPNAHGRFAREREVV